MNPLEKTLLQDPNPLVRAGVISQPDMGLNKRTFVDAITESEARRRNPFSRETAQPVDVEQKSRNDLNRIISETNIAARQIYGQDEQTDPARRKALSARARRLAPAKSPGVLGSAGIAGNPYSLNTQGLMTGLGNLAVSLLNKERATRVEGFAQELTDLTTAEANNLDRKENIEKYAAGEIPRRLTEENTRQRQLDVKAQELRNSLARIEAQSESWAERERARADAARSLEELRQSGRMSLAEYNAAQRRLLEADRYNRIERTASNRAGVGATTQLMQTVRQRLGPLYRSIAELEEIVALNPDDADTKARLDGLKTQEADILKTQVGIMVTQGVMSADAANNVLRDLGYEGGITAPRNTGNNRQSGGAGSNRQSSGGGAKADVGDIFN